MLKKIYLNLKSKRSLSVFLFLILIQILITTFLISLFHPIYGVNDDLLISQFLSGNYNGRVELNLFYVQRPLTDIISVLYTLSPTLNWFVILVTVLFAASLISVYFFHYIRSYKFSFVSFSIWLIGDFLILSWFLLNPTFTASSIFISSVAFYILYLSIKYETLSGRILFFSSILILLAFQLRIRGAQLSLLIWTPVLFHILYQKRQYFLNFIKSNVTLLSFFVPIFILILFLPNIYLMYNSDLNVYYDFNTQRQEIVNTTRLIKILELLPNIGWNLSDFNIFENNAYLDQSFINSAELSKILDLSAQTQGFSGLIDPIVDVSNRLYWFKSYQHYFAAILVPAIILLFRFKFEWKSKLSSILIFIASVSMALYYVLATGKIEERVIIPIVLNLWIFTFLSIPVTKISFSKIKFSIGLLAFFITVLSLEKLSHDPIFFVEKSKYNQRAITFANQQVKSFEKLKKPFVLVGPLSAIRSNWSNPYLSPVRKDYSFVSLGWHSFSPAWEYKFMTLLPNESDLAEAVTKNPNVYWISDPTTAEDLYTQLSTRGSLNRKPNLIIEYGSEANDYGGFYNVYSFR